MNGLISILRRPQYFWTILKQTASEWNEDKVPRLGAALAYYTIFSIVPMLVMIIAMIGVVFGTDAAQDYIIKQLAELLGPQGADAIKEMIEHASQPRTGMWATIIATATLLIGASGFFGQLQEALNDIWGVAAKPGNGIWTYLKARFISLGTLLGTGFLLMVSLVLSAGLSAFGKWYQGWLPAPELALQLLEFVVSLAVITGLFAMIFKLLPDVEIGWNDVWIGAALTALLFTAGKFMIGLYIGKSDFGTAYGAAGSLVILLVWIYYSTQILLFGAEFTQVYANVEGAQVTPSKHAETMDSTKAAGSTGTSPLSSGAPTTGPIPQTAPSPSTSALLHGAFQALWWATRWAGPPLFRKTLLIAGGVLVIRKLGRRDQIVSPAHRRISP